MLKGPMLGVQGSQLMRDDVREIGVVPLEEPYSEMAGFEHIATSGGEATTQAMLDITGPDAIVDWVYVEIRQESDPDIVLASVTALIQRDGDVVDVEGNEALIFPNLVEGNYHVALSHRNHAGFMTKFTWELTTYNIPEIDFRDPSVKVDGGDAAADELDAQRVMWSGDLNGDRKIIYQGPNNDVFTLFGHVLNEDGNTTYLANYISIGYHTEDLNPSCRLEGISN